MKPRRRIGLVVTLVAALAMAISPGAAGQADPPPEPPECELEECQDDPCPPGVEWCQPICSYPECG
jgi:hypothetical protein